MCERKDCHQWLGRVRADRILTVSANPFGFFMLQRIDQVHCRIEPYTLGMVGQA
jgi:hypothetical protein